MADTQRELVAVQRDLAELRRERDSFCREADELKKQQSNHRFLESQLDVARQKIARLEVEDKDFELRRELSTAKHEKRKLRAEILTRRAELKWIELTDGMVATRALQRELVVERMARLLAEVAKGDAEVRQRARPLFWLFT